LMNAAFSGAGIWKRTGSATGGFSRKCTNASAASAAVAKAAPVQAAALLTFGREGANACAASA
jgi:hypothetical protein